MIVRGSNQLSKLSYLVLCMLSTDWLFYQHMIWVTCFRLLSPSTQCVVCLFQSPSWEVFFIFLIWNPPRVGVYTWTENSPSIEFAKKWPLSKYFKWMLVAFFSRTHIFVFLFSIRLLRISNRIALIELIWRYYVFPPHATDENASVDTHVGHHYQVYIRCVMNHPVCLSVWVPHWAHKCSDQSTKMFNLYYS